MSDEVRAAVFGNVGTMLSFRVGSYDAEVLEKEFAPAFISEDIVNLGFAQIYLKLMIKGVGSAPFSATTLPRPKMASRTFTNEVIAASRAQFARPRAEVEEEIKKWHEPIAAAPRDPNAPPIPETRKYPPGARPARPVGASAPYLGASASFSPREIPAATQIPDPSLGAVLQKITETPRVPEVPPPAAPQYTPPQASAPTPLPRLNIPVPTPSVPKLEVSAPLVKDVVHRPFAQVFSTLDQEAKPSSPPRSAPVTGAKHREDEVHVHGERLSSPPRPVTQTPAGTRATPLSMLKANPKKDKGPSAENLSSLRAVLEASLASKATKTEKTEEGSALNKKHESLPKSVTPPPVAPKKQAPLLEESEHTPSPKEVPEDVLRGLLSDE
jgi:hypothetical protein